MFALMQGAIARQTTLGAGFGEIKSGTPGAAF